ncbi:nitroreductase family protein [Paenibacillus marinisediminis]
MQTTTYPMAELIRTRRSIKQFKTDPVPTETISELLDIASWAPNHGLREPWRVVLFTGEGKQIIANAIANNGAKKSDPEPLLQIPAFLLFIVKQDPRQKEREEDQTAAAMFIQNFQLAAWERGIGSIMKTGPYIFSPSFLEEVGVKAGEKLIGVLQVGYPNVLPEPRERTPIEQKLTVVDSTSL